MISLLLSGQYALFLVIMIAIIISLTFHEFGHAATATLFGDDTARRAGRLSLNPAAHIDPVGLLLVAVVGFGFARPVPTNPRNFTWAKADLLVSAAGPGMNLLIAIIAINLYILGLNQGWVFMAGPGVEIFILYLTTINLVLMAFNLLPLGALDGHYILPHLLPGMLADRYRYWNDQYGNRLLLGLMLLSLFGLPVFSYIWRVGEFLLPLVVFIRPA